MSTSAQHVPFPWGTVSAYHEVFQQPHEAEMNFHETIQLQALKLKQSTFGAGAMNDTLVDMALQQDPTLGGLTRNICAHIPVPLFERVEQCCQTLELSKRRFVEMALIEALERAETIIAEIDPFSGVEEN